MILRKLGYFALLLSQSSILLFKIGCQCYSDSELDDHILEFIEENTQSFSFEIYRQVLKDSHVVFVGDSVTRYQYLSLVYMLRHGHVLSPSMKPNLVYEKDYPSWIDFHITSNAILSPYERCDCYRTNEWNLEEMYENRFFHDEEYNITISYFQNMGFDLKGHYPVNEEYSFPMTEFRSLNWSLDLPGTISQIFPKLSPQPTTIIICNLLWQNNFHLKSYIDSVFNAATFITKDVIFKTNTPDHNRGADRHHQVKLSDHMVCSLPTVSCYDVTWTYHLPHTTNYFWDHAHFMAPVYTKLNNQLIELLRDTSRFEKMGIQTNNQNTMIYRDGKLIRRDDGRSREIFYVFNMSLHSIPDMDTFNAMNLNVNCIEAILDFEFDSLVIGEPLPRLDFQGVDVDLGDNNCIF